MLAHRYNRPGHTIVDHRTFALVSDGDLMEGVSSEAPSLAGHLGLGKLTFLYDSNQVSLDGPTSLAFTEDVGKRFLACGWHVPRAARRWSASTPTSRGSTGRPSRASGRRAGTRSSLRSSPGKRSRRAAPGGARSARSRGESRGSWEATPTSRSRRRRLSRRRA